MSTWRFRLLVGLAERTDNVNACRRTHKNDVVAVIQVHCVGDAQPAQEQPRQDCYQGAYRQVTAAKPDAIQEHEEARQNLVGTTSALMRELVSHDATRIVIVPHQPKDLRKLLVRLRK